MSNIGTVAASSVGTKKGHPTGLYILFFTEMWERFSYYGMRALLVYYMTKELLFTQERSSSVYGLYTGFVYFTPFFGGLIADKFLGQRKAVFVGGILMAIGEFMLMSKAMFFPALIMLILGNGMFKPNISTQVGNLYDAGDHRRDSAFSIFYVGINVGAFFSPLICGTIGELYGWHLGFGTAGLGMIAGLIVYLIGQKHLAADNIMKNKQSAGKEIVPDQPLTKSDKSKIWALVVLCTLNIIFWGTYEQQGNTLALWADANTNRFIFGWEMPATWVQAFNPAMIALFTPLILWFWGKQAKKGKEMSSIAKMATGCILLGCSFLIMLIPAQDVDGGAKVSLLWLVGCTLILTVGELYLSPVGLSLVTKLAPARMVSMLMGMWFLSSFAGNYLSGFIGTYWEKMSKESFFLMLSALAFTAGLGMLAVLKPLKRAMGQGKQTVDV